MLGEITFEHFQDSDAAQVAELLNKNRFHTARNKHMTAEDYLFTQRSRGVCFSVVAKKKGKIIGLAGAYPTSDQAVAKKHQVFVGTFLVDMQYRLSYSIIMGLYNGLMKGLKDGGYKEILSGVRPQNEASYHLMLKCGFVLLDPAPNDFGRIGLHNFSPAFAKYTGEDSAEINDSTFFLSLPVVDKKEARKLQGKPLLHGRCIEVECKLNGKDVVLLFDIVNYKIDGAMVPKLLKFYPDFDRPGKYIMENLSKSKPVTAAVELAAPGKDNVRYNVTLAPGASDIITCDKDVSALKVAYNSQWYRFYPYLLEDVAAPKVPIAFGKGNLSARLDPATGFISIMAGGAKQATLVWPCATFPYIEGIFVPRIKDLQVAQDKNSLTITEDTDEYILTRRCVCLPDKLEITTTLKCKTLLENVRPISQIYAEKGVLGYTLTSGASTRTFGPADIKHEGYEYSDYAYWETKPEEFDGFPIDGIGLTYPSCAVRIAIDKKCKPIIHAPIFTSTLGVDTAKMLDQQIIEQMEIYYEKLEEKRC